MKDIFFLISLLALQQFVSAQETIDFEFSYPENSSFTIEQKMDNSGNMKIIGSPQEIADLKKAGYNENRKLRYLIDYISEYKTQTKNSNSFPFEFFYSSVLFDIDSDGKKQKRELTFPNEVLKGDLVNGKLSVIKAAETGDASQNQYINSLPRYFTVDFPKVPQMKVGESFTVIRAMESKTDGYSLNGSIKYTLTKIDKEISYFSMLITQSNEKQSILKSSGNGTGEMIYNHRDKYIVSEKMILKLKSSSDDTLKMVADNTILSTYVLKLK